MTLRQRSASVIVGGGIYLPPLTVEFTWPPRLIGGEPPVDPCDCGLGMFCQCKAGKSAS